MGEHKKEITNSYLNLWRLVVSAVHVDQRIAEEETQMVEHYLEELDFNEEQTRLLKKELQTPADVDKILSEITDPADRSQSVYFVRLLFWKDHVLVTEEGAFLKKVQDYFAQFVDIDQIQEELSQFKKEAKEKEGVLSSLPDTPVIQLWRKITSLFK